MTLEELIAIIKDAKEKHGIEGVTYSGGEPTLQKDLSAFLEKVKKGDFKIIYPEF